jgi:hypothetical protein
MHLVTFAYLDQVCCSMDSLPRTLQLTSLRLGLYPQPNAHPLAPL